MAKKPTQLLLHHVTFDADQMTIKNPKLASVMKKALESDIVLLNHCIEQYNTVKPSHIAQRKIRLKQVYKQLKYIEYKYPPNDLGRLKSYQDQVTKRLYQQIQSQCTEVGVSFLKDLSPPQPNSSITTHELAELIVSMTSEEIIDLTRQLLDNHKILNNPFINKNKPEYARFNHFLKTHSLEYLGGKNSTNFKLTNARGKTFVLKVENRLNTPRAAEMHLRTKILSHVIAPIAAERQVSFNDVNGNWKTRTLVVTEHYIGGDLEKHSLQFKNDTQLLSSAIHIYIQMLNTLILFNRHYYLFPDMKNSNWLLTTDGQLKISDMKAPLPANADIYHPYKTVSVMYDFDGIIATNNIMPPELLNNELSIDKAHMYMLGINIYQYLSKKRLKQIAFPLDFSLAVFKTSPGERLKQLIMDCTKENPSSRPSSDKVLIILNRAQFLMNHKDSSLSPEKIEPETKPTKSLSHPTDSKSTDDIAMEETHGLLACEAIMQYLNENKTAFIFGSHDEKMKNILSNQEEKLCLLEQKIYKPHQKNRENHLAEIQQLHKELENIKKLSQNPMIKEIKNIIDNFRRPISFFNIGMSSKAAQIEKAMAALDVQDRIDFLSKEKIKKAASFDLQKALATHRHFNWAMFSGNVYLKEDLVDSGEGVHCKRKVIDTDKAAHSFKKIRQLYEDPTSADHNPVAHNTKR